MVRCTQRNIKFNGVQNLLLNNIYSYNQTANHANKYDVNNTHNFKQIKL